VSQGSQRTCGGKYDGYTLEIRNGSHSLAGSKRMMRLLNQNAKQ